MNTAKNRRRPAASSRPYVSPEQLGAVCQRLAKNLQVRRTLPGGGRLHIDRQLPFLCVYRHPPNGEDAGTQQLVRGEAAYLVASGAPGRHAELSQLVGGVVRTLAAEFGAFLIVEIWAGQEGGAGNDPAIPTVSPAFTVHAPTAAALTRPVEALAQRLGRIKVLKQAVEVAVVRGGASKPPGMRPLLTRADARELGCSSIGLAVPPVYRKADSTDQFPLLARSLRSQLSLALRRAYFEFARSCTTQRPAHFHTMGRRAVVKAVWEVDRQLAEVSDRFDYLLQLTPVNAAAAYKQFRRDRFERQPEFHYRPLPVDPDLLKRALYRIPVERIEDPAIQWLMQQKREELELQLTMLRDRDTPRFIFESLQLFGGAGDELLARAEALLGQLPARGERGRGRAVDAPTLAARAEEEFERYRRASPVFEAKAEVTTEVAGLLVSRGKLLIGADVTVPRRRVEALMAHEVGTHLVTYCNGRAQPLQQLYAGLAGYEELQEGLAVLSEHLVGGLSRARMRQLAGRVVAVRQLVDGASLIEAFRLLHRDFGFAARAAYNIAMRVYRGGGLTKDVIYLRGLEQILGYLQQGGELEPLLVGKIALQHIPMIQELQYREVLTSTPIVPRYLEAPQSIERLSRLRGGKISVADLVCAVEQ